MDHSIYDKRRYPIVDAREGYGAWVRTYDQTVLDEMDLRLLERVRTVDWSAARSVLDLACGTGEPVTIRSYVHLLSDHVKAAHAAGWSLQEMDEGLVDDAWLLKKPRLRIYAGLPISFSMVWRRR